MAVNKKFKNILFDLGGVLIDIDFEQTRKAFNRILKPEAKANLNWDELPEVVTAMETGRWSKDKFKAEMLRLCNPGISAYQMVDAWCAMIQEFPSFRLTMLRNLAKTYNLYLLSNTNTYHIRFFEFEFLNRYHVPLKKEFKKVYYSSQIGYRKPDPESFRYVLKDAGLIAAETVLVDDRQDNCDTAESLGMLSIKVPENTGLEAVIEQIL
ncbi:MAG: HAD family phosphatase [Prolixibacteraceae bacterium]|nr:HAD family phosphatase [Prolixibacteraceae bacterium]